MSWASSTGIHTNLVNFHANFESSFKILKIFIREYISHELRDVSFKSGVLVYAIFDLIKGWGEGGWGRTHY